MSDTKFRISVLGKQSVVTGAELDTLLANDPQGLIEVIGPSGEEKKADSVYQNQDGAIVRESLSAEQLRNRKALGEANIITGANDPKLDLWRKDLQHRTTMEMAGELENLPLVAMRNFVPGIQYLEDAAVGEEDATYARQTLIAANRFTHLASQIGAFFAAGQAAKFVFPNTFLARAIGAKRSTIKARTAQIAVEDLLLETHLYTQHVLNNNQEYLTEDWAGQMVEGLAFASPFIASFGARAAVGRLGGAFMDSRFAQGVGAVGSGVFGTIANLAVIRGLTQTGAAAGKTMRFSSGARLIERVGVFRRLGRSSKAVLHTMDAEKNLRRLWDDAAEIQKWEPEFFAKLNMRNRRAALERVRELSGQALDDIDPTKFGDMIKEMRAVRTTSASAAKQIRKLNRQVGYPKNLATRTGAKRRPQDLKEPPRWNEVDEAVYKQRAEDLLYDLDEAGYGTISDHLRQEINIENVRLSHGKWAQARLDARFKAKGSPWETVQGSARADELIRDFLEDPAIWKDKTLQGRGAKINQAIDEISDAWDEIYSARLPDKFDEVSMTDAAYLNHYEKQFDVVREGYKKLEGQGLLTANQRRALEDELSKAGRVVADGRQAYMKAAQLNDARRVADDIVTEKWQKEGIARPKTQDEFEAALVQNAAENAANLVTLRHYIRGAFNWLEKGTNVPWTRNTSFGVLALRYAASPDERRAIYKDIRENITSLAGNPAALEIRLAEATSSIEGVSPMGAFTSQQRAAQNILWLNQQLPKMSETLPADEVEQHISVVDEFLDKFMAAYEPMSVAFLAPTGRITPAMVTAVRNTNPVMYAEMYNVMAEEYAKLSKEEKLKAPREVIMGMEVFLGGLSPAYNGFNLIQLQSNYAQTRAEQQVMQGPQTGNTLNNRGPQDPGSSYTSTQRIMGY